MLNLKNNFIMATIKTGYGNKNGKLTNRHVDFYLRRAKYIGAMTLEPLFMDKALRELPTQIGIDNDEKISDLKKLTEKIHKYNTKVIAHLNHPGRMANPKIPNNYYISSSANACEAGGAIPKEANKEDIKHIINMFKTSAIRAESAGFDIIELQFGHGYLIAQFMSEKINKRKDEYGGNFENRTRLAIEIFDEVKKAVNIPIMIRISGSEMIPDGIKTEEVIKLSKILEKKGAVALHVSSGSLCSTPPWFFHHLFVPGNKTKEIALKIQKKLSIPVIPVGQINTKENIGQLGKNFKYLSIGKALVADPDFIGKIMGKIDEPYRPCMSCMDGCLGGVKSGKGLGCVVNPKVGKNIKFQKTETAKKFAVIGAGLAGLEAAIRLKQKGHFVDLYENNKVGGQFNLAYLPPKKAKLKSIIDYYKKMIKKYNIVVYKENIQKEDIQEKMYDGVIFATGSKPFVPVIKGLKSYHWAEILEVNKKMKNKNVLIVGGGLIGLEVAHSLILENNNVTIVEMLDELAGNMEMISKKLTIKALKDSKKAKIYTSKKVVEIKDKQVFLNDGTIIENIDEIVISAGMKPYHYLENELMGLVSIYFIGDANKVANAQSAIEDGLDIALRL